MSDNDDNTFIPAMNIKRLIGDVKKNYAKVAKEHPSWKATECIKEIAKMWKNKK